MTWQYVAEPTNGFPKKNSAHLVQPFGGQREHIYEYLNLIDVN